MKASSESRAAVIALWVAFSVVAVSSGWLAVHLVGGAITPGSVPVVSAEEVSRRLATASEPSTRSPTASDTTSGPRPSQQTSDQESSEPDDARAVVRTLTSAGGSVLAACADGQVTLRSVSPAVGFRVDELEDGPGDEVEVRFVSASSEVKMQVECVSGVPRAQTEVDDESGDDD